MPAVRISECKCCLLEKKKKGYQQQKMNKRMKRTLPRPRGRNEWQQKFIEKRIGAPTVVSRDHFWTHQENLYK